MAACSPAVRTTAAPIALQSSRVAYEANLRWTSAPQLLAPSWQHCAQAADCSACLLVSYRAASAIMLQSAGRGQANCAASGTEQRCTHRPVVPAEELDGRRRSKRVR